MYIAVTGVYEHEQKKCIQVVWAVIAFTMKNKGMFHRISNSYPNSFLLANGVVVVIPDL